VTGEPAPGPPPSGAPPDPGSPPEAAEPGRAPTAADRWILGAFCVWVLLLLIGAFAQVTDNRAILDLFDLHRWFTR